MKNISLLLLCVCLFLISSAQTNVSGGIYSNTTWTKANSPYIVTDTVVVFPNVTLTIEAGVVVKFDDDKRLEIRYAKLVAEGTSTDSITFTSNSGSPHPGSWSDIWLNQDTSSKFNFCNFHYANYAINQYLTRNITYKNSVFSYNNNGIGGSHSNTGINALVDSCIFIYNADFGIERIDRSIVTNCIFLYDSIAINVNNEGGNKFDHCVFDNNLIGILRLGESEVNNCIIKNGSYGIIGGGYGVIRNSHIDSNTIVGIDCGGSDTVINCRVTNNVTGLNLFMRETISQNIIENNTIGISVEYTNNNVYCNRICNNSSYNLYYNVSGNNSSFGSNYWCSADSAAIAATIFDGYDNINLSLADFIPFDTTQCYQQNCSAHFTLYPDNNVLHTYYIANMAHGTGVLNYIWNWGDGSTDTAAYPSHTYVTGGLYTICLTITDAIGCSNYYCSDFSLQRTTNTMVQVSVLPGVNTGIPTETGEQFSFRIFPNPASNFADIAVDEALVNSNLTITDLTGRTLTQTKLTSVKMLLATEALPNGLYFVTVDNGEQQTTQKLIIGR